MDTLAGMFHTSPAQLPLWAAGVGGAPGGVQEAPGAVAGVAQDAPHGLPQQPGVGLVAVRLQQHQGGVEVVEDVVRGAWRRPRGHVPRGGGGDQDAVRPQRRLARAEEHGVVDLGPHRLGDLGLEERTRGRSRRRRRPVSGMGTRTASSSAFRKRLSHFMSDVCFMPGVAVDEVGHRLAVQDGQAPLLAGHGHAVEGGEGEGLLGGGGDDLVGGVLRDERPGFCSVDGTTVGHRTFPLSPPVISITGGLHAVTHSVALPHLRALPGGDAPRSSWTTSWTQAEGRTLAGPSPGALNNQGYGAIQRYPDDWTDRRRGKHGREVRAHRLAFALAQGHTGADADQALGDTAVRHLCDERYAPGDISYRRCCNPAHLAGGTLAENTAHMCRVGRQQDYTHRARGERVGTAVLGDAQVAVMRERFAAGESGAALAAAVRRLPSGRVEGDPRPYLRPPARRPTPSGAGRGEPRLAQGQTPEARLHPRGVGSVRPPYGGTGPVSRRPVLAGGLRCACGGLAVGPQPVIH